MAGIPVIITGELVYSGLSVGGGPIEPSPPVGIWPSPGHPAHPIAPGGPPPQVMPPIYYPPSIWPPGGGVHPMPPIYYPPSPPVGIWPSPGHPAHPIAPGGPPPQAMPPIYYPPEIWPTPPSKPPGGGEPPSGPPGGEGNWAWSPIYGWVWVPSGGGGKPHPPEPPPIDPNAPTVNPLPA